MFICDETSMGFLNIKMLIVFCYLMCFSNGECKFGNIVSEAILLNVCVYVCMLYVCYE